VLLVCFLVLAARSMYLAVELDTGRAHPAPPRREQGCADFGVVVALARMGVSSAACSWCPVCLWWSQARGGGGAAAACAVSVGGYLVAFHVARDRFLWFQRVQRFAP